MNIGVIFLAVLLILGALVYVWVWRHEDSLLGEDFGYDWSQRFRGDTVDDYGSAVVVRIHYTPDGEYINVARQDAGFYLSDNHGWVGGINYDSLADAIHEAETMLEWG